MSKQAEDQPQEVIIDWLSGFCPVQAEGKIAGIPFYFRARSASWRLHIGADPMSDSAWSTGDAYGEGFDAGWMEEDEARAFIARGAGLWFEERKLEPSAAYAAYLEAELAWEVELRREGGTDAAHLRYTPEGKGLEGSELRRLRDLRDAALVAWEASTQLPILRQENREE